MKFATLCLASLFCSYTSAFTSSIRSNNGVSLINKNVNKFGVRRWMSSEIAVPPTTEVEMSSEFEAVRDATLEQLKGQLNAVNAKPELISGLVHFVNEYFGALSMANAQGNEDITPEFVAKQIVSAIQYGMAYGTGEDKYTFGVQHRAQRDYEGNDFYKFGCNFFRPAMDLENSPFVGKENLDEAMDFIKQGHNVVFFANHQSEADPQVVSCMLEKCGYSQEASEIYFVAGHKVTTDTLAIPFSMGRNLICIHSKKHLDADMDTKPVKQKQNLMAMTSMLKLLRDPDQGCMIWVAPSGGRDRRDLTTNQVPIAPFDQKTIDMFRLMGNKSKQPMHYYSMSMISYDLCPPPDFVEVGTGEQRNVRFVPVGLTVSKELENKGGVETRHLFTEHAEEECQLGYQALLEAMDTSSSSSVPEKPQN
uniref:Phospholipid/glycerol acyltransferase domain-containing protein n=1 Tax=Eucampia antarctica TaxID=49252 RepID=A0A7S2RGB4_9STRA